MCISFLLYIPLSFDNNISDLLNYHYFNRKNHDLEIFYAYSVAMKIATYKLGICQSISSTPISRKMAFVRENGLLPKKPLAAENGLG